MVAFVEEPQRSLGSVVDVRGMILITLRDQLNQARVWQSSRSRRPRIRPVWSILTMVNGAFWQPR